MNRKQNIIIFDKTHRNIGNVDVEIRVKFNEDINRILYSADLIDFDNILQV